MRAAFDRLPGPGYLVLVPGMFHVDSSDFPLFSPLVPQVTRQALAAPRREKDREWTSSRRGRGRTVLGDEGGGAEVG